MKNLTLIDNYREGLLLEHGEHSPKNMISIHGCKQVRINGQRFHYILPNGESSNDYTNIYRGQQFEYRLIGFIK